MDGQMTIFDLVNKGQDSYMDRINKTLDTIAKEEDLLEKSIYVRENYGKKSGELTSYSICLYEPEYPPLKEGVHGGSSIVTFKEEDKLIFMLSEKDEIELPKEGERLKDSIAISKESNALEELIRNIVIYRIRNYKSSAKFSCCSRFKECSDARKCIHPNRLYATGCTYRKNLENGKIFY